MSNKNQWPLGKSPVSIKSESQKSSKNLSTPTPPKSSPQSNNLASNTTSSQTLNNNTSTDSLNSNKTFSTTTLSKSSLQSNNSASNTVSIESPNDDSVGVIKVEETKNNNDVVKTEKIRNVYIIASVKAMEKSFLTIAEDNQMAILKINPSQQVYTTNFHMLVNVKYDTTRDTSGFKIIKAGNILKGKTFSVDMVDVDKRIGVHKIKLEGAGKDAADISDNELKQAKESSLIEKLTVKVKWISNHIFSDHQNVKVLTKKGLPLLISLNSNHHNTLKKDEVFSFINVTKTENWKSGNVFFKDVNMKFKTTSETSIIHIPHPSQAFLQLGKTVAKVIGIEPNLFIFDQCKECFKAKYNNTCGQENCTEYGIKTPYNGSFVTNMVIDIEDNQDEIVETVKIWNNQLIDFPFSNLVPKSDFETAIVLEDLERHYMDKMISYKVKTTNSSQDEAIKTITTVTLKPSDMDVD